MRYGVHVHFLKRWKAPQILPRFQQHGQDKTARFSATACANEGVVRLRQRIAGSQFLMVQPRIQARVCGAIDRCHQCPEKGSPKEAIEVYILEGTGGSDSVSAKEYPKRVIGEIEELAANSNLSIRQIQSKIAGRASRGIVGEITKRARAAQPVAL